MNNISVEYLANAGFLICGGRHKIVLDSIFSRRFLPFSAMQPEILEAILQGKGEFSDAELVLSTHCHPDHCNPQDVLRLQKPDVTLIIPPDAYGEDSEKPKQTLISPREDGIVWEDASLCITAIRTVHDRDGDIAEKRIHYSYLLEFKHENCCILVMGDAATGPHLFDRWLEGKHVSAVIINFVEMNQEKGREFMRELKPDMVILCHLPLPEDDNFHIAKLARRSLDKYQEELPPCILCSEPHTKIELK